MNDTSVNGKWLQVIYYKAIILILKIQMRHNFGRIKCSLITLNKAANKFYEFRNGLRSNALIFCRVRWFTYFGSCFNFPKTPLCRGQEIRSHV